MAETNKEYWTRRAAKLEDRAHRKGEALNKKLLKEYSKAAREIKQRIEAFYGRYATEQGLSYAEAVKSLTRAELREWKKTLAAYVDEINAMPAGKIKDRLIAELDARSYASQQDRLSQLAAQIDMEIDRLTVKTEGQMTLAMTDVLEDGYIRKTFDLQQRAGVISPFARLSTAAVEDALTYPWSGADFSTRIWENKRALLYQARQTITQGLIQGQSVAAMSNNLADTLGKSYRAAERLVRTETNHFHAEADKLAYSAAGVEEYEFIATLDHRTSEVCARLDGKHFPISEAKPGTNYPPMHPNCRSTTVEYDPEDAADWAASGQPMPENMTYDEWLEEQQDLSPMAAEADRIEWPEKRDPITTEQYKDLMQYANEKRVNLQNFRHFDGDIETAKGIVDDTSEMLALYPGVNDGRREVVVELGNEFMDSRDFAKTDGRIITINPKAFRNTERLAEEYKKLVDDGWFVKGTDWRAIIKHEFGHVVANCYKIDGMAIAKMALQTESKVKVLDYCMSNLSEYSAASKNGAEIIAECFASVYNSSDKNSFALTFVEECANLILKKGE